VSTESPEDTLIRALNGAFAPEPKASRARYALGIVAPGAPLQSSPAT